MLPILPPQGEVGIAFFQFRVGQINSKSTCHLADAFFIFKI